MPSPCKPPEGCRPIGQIKEEIRQLEQNIFDNRAAIECFESRCRPGTVQEKMLIEYHDALMLTRDRLRILQEELEYQNRQKK